MASAHAEVESVARSNFAFSNTLHEALRNNGEEGNLVFSPFSLGIVLLMARFGARERTAQQLDRVLNPLDSSARKELDDLVPMRRGFFRVLKSIDVDQSSDYKVTVANRMFIKDGFNVQDNFKKISKATLDIKVKQLNFTEDGGRPAAEAINSWIVNKTNGRINGLIYPDAFDSTTRVVLVNTVHFKATWEIPFDPEDTHNATFHLNFNEHIQVAMLKSEGRYEHGDVEALNAHAVFLRYQGGRYSMHVYIPKAKDGLDGLLHVLKNTSMQQIRENLVKPSNCEKVELSLPKFKIESTLKLVEPLKEMGAWHMFTTGADFSGMSEDENLYVTDALQKAYISVDEEGTEASAASYILAEVTCAPSITPVAADRPFYFQIVDEQNDMVLFAGAVRDPRVFGELDVLPTSAASSEQESPTIGTTTRPPQPMSIPSSLQPRTVNVQKLPETTSAADVEPKIIIATYQGGIQAYSETTKIVTTVIYNNQNLAGVTWDSSNSKLYYSSPSTIYTANIDGSGIETAGSLSSAYGDIMGLEVEWITGHLYVATEGGYILACRPGRPGPLICFPVISTQGRIYGLALDPLHRTMYWTLSPKKGMGSIWRASLDGSNAKKIVAGLSYPCGIAIDHEASRLLWTDYSGHQIKSCDLNGRHVTVAVTGENEPGPWGIAVHNGKVYWGDFDAKRIQSSTKNGQNIANIQSVHVGSPISHLAVVTGKVRQISQPNPCASRLCPGICVLTPASYRCL